MRNEVTFVVTVPVYEETVITLVDVSVMVPEKVVLDTVKELWSGTNVAAAEWLSNETNTHIATEAKRRLQRSRDAFNQGAS